MNPHSPDEAAFFLIELDKPVIGWMSDRFSAA